MSIEREKRHGKTRETVEYVRRALHRGDETSSYFVEGSLMEGPDEPNKHTETEVSEPNYDITPVISTESDGNTDNAQLFQRLGRDTVSTVRRPTILT